MNRKVVLLIGASGVGKTSVASALEKKDPWRGNTFYSDTMGVPSQEEMERWPGGAEGWQKWATEQWVSRLAGRDTPLQLLEMQTRPSFILSALGAFPDLDPVIILLECSQDARTFRLTDLRQQPELASSRMECWAAYLRGQADALGFPTIQTDNLTVEEVAIEVGKVVEVTAGDPPPGGPRSNRGPKSDP
jgi:hypothetical protein